MKLVKFIKRFVHFITEEEDENARKVKQILKEYRKLYFKFINKNKD